MKSSEIASRFRQLWEAVSDFRGSGRYIHRPAFAALLQASQIPSTKSLASSEATVIFSVVSENHANIIEYDGKRQAYFGVPLGWRVLVVVKFL